MQIHGSFLSFEAPNLHDAAKYSRSSAAFCAAVKKPHIIPAENHSKWTFPLKISLLSYAFYALLRRNIIAFHTPEYPYFAGNSIHRLGAGS